MKRIEQTFKSSKVFAAYITAGDGDVSTQLSQIRALMAAGVNLLEIGVPFSDPIADGVVIQRAMQRALKNKTDIWQVLALVKAIREVSEIPIILFTYYNPIYQCQKKQILQQAKAAGVDGILVLDLPFFEAETYLAQCHTLDLAPIAVISPSTTTTRLNDILKDAKGFLYYACRKGTTGVREGMPDDLNENIAKIKACTDLPVLVGFGIQNQAAANAALSLADGFVVGSYFIQAIEEGVSADQLQQLAAAINPLNGEKHVTYN